MKLPLLLKQSTCALLAMFVFSDTALANLLISPTRVAFSDRERVQSITLINSGNETKSYRMGWEEKRVDDNGNYVMLTDEEKQSFPIASPYLRFTPRQVTLGPGERQVVKVLARRKANMPEQEYRSHLLFTALPIDRSNDNRSPSKGMLMKLNLLMSYSVPVLLRNGEASIETQIEEVVINPVPEKPNMRQLLVKLSQKGNISSTGSLNAYYIPFGSNNSINVGTLNDFSFYNDSPTQTKELIWHTPIPENSKGSLTVVFEGKKEFSGQVLAQKEVTLQ